MAPRALTLLSALALLGCAGAQSPLAEQGRPAKRTPGAEKAGIGVAALQASELAKVPAGTFGPYVGSRGEAALMVWAAPEGEQKRAWYTLALGYDARPVGKPLRIADAPAEIGLVAVKAADGGQAPGASRQQAGLHAWGFVVVTTHPAEQVEVKAMVLGPRGELRGGPTLLAQPQSDVLWVDAVATKRGSVVLWAVRDDDRAELFAVEVGREGQRRGKVKPVLSDALAWQVVRVPGGAAIGAVLAGAERGSAGPVKIAFIDETASRVAKPTTVSSEETAGLDLDLARVGSSLLMAWSDSREIEPKIYLAVLDARGKIERKPAPVTRNIGEEALVQLVPPFDAAGPAFLAWERIGERTAEGRAIRVAPVAADGSVGEARAEVRLNADDTVPEFAASSSGLAALTLARVCAREGACKSAPTLPTFVQFDSKLELVASEPMRLDALDGGAVNLSWGLSCRKPGCLALAALESSPAPVFAVRLQARSKTWKPAGARVLPEPAPRAVSLQAVAQLDPVHDVSVLPVGGATLAAWVTFFDPTTPYVRRKTAAPDGRFAPLRALLQVQASTGAEGKPAPVQTMSLRARSLAGVALAPGRPGEQEALLVWSAIDRKQPEVFLTLLGVDGKSKRQKMLTRSPGEVSDVAAVNVGDGWLVAWVDERHKDPEVYVTRVDRRLRRASPERRLTRAPGAATGIAMHVVGEHTRLVWADARNAKQPGWADIFTIRVRNKDAKPVGKERAVAKTRAHSHSPWLAALGDDLVLAWLESKEQGAAQNRGGTLHIGQLDAEGRFVSPPQQVAVRAGFPTSLALDCSDQQCRVVMSVETDAGSELDAFTWKPGSQPEVRKLISLTGPASQPAAPALLGRQLYYADQTKDRQGRVHRMLIDWE